MVGLVLVETAIFCFLSMQSISGLLSNDVTLSIVFERDGEATTEIV